MEGSWRHAAEMIPGWRKEVSVATITLPPRVAALADMLRCGAAARIETADAAARGSRRQVTACAKCGL